MTNISLRQKRRFTKILIQCAIVLALIVALFLWGKFSGIDWVAYLHTAGGFFADLPEQLSQLSIVSAVAGVFSEMHMVQWIIAAVFLGIFLFFIRGTRSSELRKASIVWSISALFYGVVFVLLFSKLNLAESGLFLILAAIAELLALINCIVVAGLGIFGGICCTYLQIIVLLPVGGIFLGVASYAQEQGHTDKYQFLFWLFQLVVFLVILGYQALVFLPSHGSYDSDDPIQTMLGTEIELSDWVDDM